LEAEKRALNESERVAWMEARKAWLDKENEYRSMLRQKSKIRWDVEGDENSKFFHSYIKRRNNKGSIRGMMVNGLWCEDPSAIKDEMVRHYKLLFSEGSSVRPLFCCEWVQKILMEDATSLEKEFSKAKIVGAIRSCGGDKAPGPDGFNFRYIRKFLDIIKLDLVRAVKWFGESMEISRGCNASFVTLIPKVTDPIGLGDFRPISLIGCYYKIIAKILAERVKKVVGNVVGEVQNAFIKGRFILDGVLIANETVDHLKKNRSKGLIFKVDFEKAYDSLNWRFLIDIMKKMRFGDRWCKWVDSCLRSSTMPILVNGSPTNEFCLERGVRQVKGHWREWDEMWSSGGFSSLRVLVYQRWIDRDGRFHESGEFTDLKSCNKVWWKKDLTTYWYVVEELDREALGWRDTILCHSCGDVVEFRLWARQVLVKRLCGSGLASVLESGFPSVVWPVMYAIVSGLLSAKRVCNALFILIIIMVSRVGLVHVAHGWCFRPWCQLNGLCVEIEVCWDFMLSL
ncbi:kinase-like domain, beta-lactamase/transpeptidase-like protein, partial [Tanacetum coccineum]